MSFKKSRLPRVLTVMCASAIALLELTGCASGAAYPPAPRSAQTPDHRYKIGPLDSLNIVV
jgi:polysaccharide export outer membrane protein